MKRAAYLFAVIAAILLIIILAITSIELVAFDESFYREEYGKLGIAQNIGIPEEDLMKGTNALIDYMRGNDASLKVKVTIMGRSVNIFSSNEIKHMEDVQKLFVNTLALRNWSIALCLICIVAAILLAKRQSIRVLTKSYFWVLSIFALMIIAIGAWVIIDFNAFWTAFHKVFFTNDLWIMDPSSSFMIQMFPAAFFFDMVAKIAVSFVASLLIILAVCIVTRLIIRLMGRAPVRRGRRV